jgi:hypothetical protein
MKSSGCEEALRVHQKVSDLSDTLLFVRETVGVRKCVKFRLLLTPENACPAGFDSAHSLSLFFILM